MLPACCAWACCVPCELGGAAISVSVAGKVEIGETPQSLQLPGCTAVVANPRPSRQVLVISYTYIIVPMQHHVRFTTASTDFHRHFRLVHAVYVSDTRDCLTQPSIHPRHDFVVVPVRSSFSGALMSFSSSKDPRPWHTAKADFGSTRMTRPAAGAGEFVKKAVSCVRAPCALLVRRV